jgi:hypothetical protein
MRQIDTAYAARSLDIVLGAIHCSATAPLTFHKTGGLNNTQRLIIVVGLLLIASALALVFLRFGYVYEYTNCFRLFVLNERTDSFINESGDSSRVGGP